MSEAEDRLEETVREFVADYLPSFLALLCDQGVEPEQQRIRADRLVRSLVAADIQSDLRENGRRIIVKIDDSTEPPKLVFNQKFVEDVEASEALGLLEKPIEQLLELTPFRVNLLIQIDDADSRKTLVNRARRSGEAQLAGLADIPSVVELRLRVFLERLERAAEAFSSKLDPDVDVRDAVRTVVSRDASNWPSWEQVASSSFLEDLLEQLEGVLRNTPSSPKAETTAEICWESLELSSRSSVRQAAKLLRAERNDALDLGSTLRKLADVVSGGRESIPESADGWREYRDLHEKWAKLFRSEQRRLAWSPVRRGTPDLSVFEPPLRSLRLDEPESLPWECPLLCWNVRERRALGDLLEGTRSTIESKADRGGASPIAIDSFFELQPFEPADSQSEFALRPAPSGSLDDEHSGAARARAVRACYGRMFRKFCRLDQSQQRSLLERLRSSYDGYFEDVPEVWDRRFQAWESYEPPRALKCLAREIEHILGPSTLFEPFESGMGEEPGQIPSFVCVAPFEAGRDVAYVRVPLTAVRASFEQSPVAVRAVEVPEEESEACRWLGDEQVTMRDLIEMPAESLLEVIRGDAVCLQIERG